VLTELQATPADPDRVDMASERVLVEIHKPASNHNGGTLRFGPDDGYLYLFVGDGGGANDVGFGHTPGTGNAQDLATLLGKVLRIDVDTASGGRLYGIPSTNPFVGEPSIRPEIYAYGLRNPAYAAFDSGGDHHLYAWNAGQALFESAYRIVRGGNFGWNIREGTHCFNPASPARPPTTCPITGSRGEPLTGPIVELGHDAGNTIVGGMIYRGNELTGLQGSMIYGTWSGRGGSGAVLLSSPPPRDARSSNEMWETAELRIAKNPGGRVNAYVRGVYEGADGEAYLLINHNAGPVEQPPTGEIWKFVPADSPGLEPV
jgi:glucose/arabinose dehydrogenase